MTNGISFSGATPTGAEFSSTTAPGAELGDDLIARGRGRGLTPLTFDGDVPNAQDLDIPTGTEEGNAEARVAIGMNGRFIGSNGLFYQPSDSDVVSQMERSGLSFTPLTGNSPMFNGPVVVVNGVTVQPATAHINAQRIADQTGNDVVAIYNGPTNNLANARGRTLEFRASAGHSTHNSGIENQVASQNVALAVLEQVYSESGETLTLIPHSEGAAYVRAGLDVAKEQLMRNHPDATEAQIDELISYNVDVVSMGAGSTRFPPSTDGVHYLHLDDGVIGNLGISREWGSQSTVILSLENAPGDGANRNHRLPSYIDEVSPSDMGLDPGYYFKDASTGQVFDVAVERTRVGRGQQARFEYRLIALDQNGQSQGVVFEQGDEFATNGALGNRLGTLFNDANRGGLDPQSVSYQEGGRNVSYQRISLSDLDRMPATMNGQDD